MAGVRRLFAGQSPVSLTLEPNLAIRKSVPFRSWVWPRLLNEIAPRVFKLD